MARRLRLSFIAALAMPLLASCAAAPPSPAEQADLDTCTAQANAAYTAQNIDALSRTSQNGLYYAPMPNHVFDSQRMGSLNQRNNQILDCVQNGTGAAAFSAPLFTPHIVGQ
jgi:hypothetical protein